MKENVKDKEWVYDNTLITHNNSYGEDIFSISKHKMIDVYNMNYQDAVRFIQDTLAELEKKSE